jgi:hypothetical protein
VEGAGWRERVCSSTACGEVCVFKPEHLGGDHCGAIGFDQEEAAGGVAFVHLVFDGQGRGDIGFARDGLRQSQTLTAVRRAVEGLIGGVQVTGKDAKQVTEGSLPLPGGTHVSGNIPSWSLAIWVTQVRHMGKQKDRVAGSDLLFEECHFRGRTGSVLQALELIVEKGSRTDPVVVRGALKAAAIQSEKREAAKIEGLVGVKAAQFEIASFFTGLVAQGRHEAAIASI